MSLLLLLELLFIPRILQVSRHLAGRVPDYHDICQLTSGILLLLFSREGLLLCLPMLCVTILCCALLLSMMYCSSRWVTGSILKRLYNYYTTQYYGSTLSTLDILCRAWVLPCTNCNPSFATRQLARARHYTADAHARLPQTGINIHKGLCSYGRFRPESGIATMTQQQSDQVIDAYGQRYADILMYALVES